TIGTGAMAPATAISAFHATFAQGLLEALVQLAAGEEAVLLVAYDGASTGPLANVSPSTGLLGAAMVLSRNEREGARRIQVMLADGMPTPPNGPLAMHARANAMAPMLPLFDSLAAGDPGAALDAGRNRLLRAT
ncbi:beta-ketoacyl synthase chain length factor, partial [Lysobacter sp. D1-1-M9]|uniref:beta-ketoacyl synthase chain length factor n=1 Tax=Novilysobacter longmucuonensis TaxID=3098603 RepID=UPI002FC5A166